jgi:hypothetical protein
MTSHGLNSFLYRHFAKHRSAANDLRDVQGGQPLRVMCLTLDLGRPNVIVRDGRQFLRHKVGYLHVDPHALHLPITWRALVGGETVSVPRQPRLEAIPMWGLEDVRIRATYGRRMSALAVATADGPRRIAVPTADLGVVAYALTGSSVPVVDA